MPTKKIARLYDDNDNKLFTDGVDIIDRSSGVNFSEHIANRKAHAQWVYNTSDATETDNAVADAPESAIFIEDNSIIKQKINGDAVVIPTGSPISSDTDNLLELTETGLKVAHKIVTLAGNSGTLSAEDFAILKSSIYNVIERNNIIFNYSSHMDDGKMRYTALNKYTDDDEYYYTILVDATTGDWTFEYDRIYLCRYPNVPPTTVANPSGVSGPFFYSIVNDLLHLQWDGVSVATAGTIYLWSNFPSKYLPKQNKQQCTVGIDFTSGYSNAFLYINPSGVRMKAWRTGTSYWGSLTLHLDF